VHLELAPDDVMLTSLKTCRSPTKKNILLKFCVKKNVTAPVNLFVNFRTKTGVAMVGLDHLIKKIDESDSTARKSGSGRRRTASHDDNIDTVADLVQSQDSGGQSADSLQC